MSRLLRVAAAPVALALARLRRRPARWLLPAGGIALAATLGCATAGQATLAGDQAARSTLAGLAPAAATVRVSTQGNGDVDDARVTALLGPTTRVALLAPLRLGRTVVQLAAITPLSRWATGPASAAPCTPARCPLLLAAGARPGGDLRLAGAGLLLGEQVRVSSAVPLGFRPLPGPTHGPGDPPPPLLVSGDIRGLEHLPGLASAYRTTTWVAPLPVGTLHSWELAPLAARLQTVQAELGAADGSLSLTAPFDALAAARARAAQAPTRLLLAGGGAAAILVAFGLLAAGALRADLALELVRLRSAGATRGQQAALVGVEAAAVSGLGLLAGSVLGLLLVWALAAGAGEPPGAVVAHGLLTPTAGAALLGGWAAIALLLAAFAGLRGDRRGTDAVGLAAVAALALALARDGTPGASDPLPLLLAPLCCLAAGGLVLRAAGVLLRAGGRLARGAPLPVRLALVNLARASGAAAGAAAFLTVSVGLGAFALSYRATLARAATDQASSQVPVDAIVSAGPSFASPLALASPARWQAIAGGPVLPVRRTQASFPRGGETATVPMLGVPARGLASLRGGAPDARLAARLVPPGPVRAPGALLPPKARSIGLTAQASGIDLVLTAVLRAGDGALTTLPLGAARSSPRRLRAALPAPAGSKELAGLELDQPAGLTATSGHQNAESPAPETRLRARLSITGAEALDAAGRPLGALRIRGWQGRGAASGAAARPAGLVVAFDAGGATGFLRPPQPGDAVPLPVIVDPATASQAGRDGGLGLTVDGVPVTARVVGRLGRFPTVGADAGGFVVADEAALASRLEAATPVPGRPDELWLSAPHLERTRAALRDPALAFLAVAYRADIERALRSDPVLDGVGRTLAISALAALVLAALGLLVVARDRDRTVEADLAAQGMGPRALGLDVRLRLLVVAGLGLATGVAAGIGLSRLAVAALGAPPAAPGAPAPAPLVAVLPWAQLAVFVLACAAGLGATAWAATRRGPARA